MAQPVELVPLVCIKCGVPIVTGPEEVAWVCKSCGQGMTIDDSLGLCALPVSYVVGLSTTSAGKPFWVVEGQVTLERETYSGNQQKAAQQFWSQPHQFFIPAYACSLDQLLATGISLIHKPPSLEAGPQASFEPVILPTQDVQAVAEFIVMAIEAERKDMLKSVHFALKLSQPKLWILPVQSEP